MKEIGRKFLAGLGLRGCFRGFSGCQPPRPAPESLPGGPSLSERNAETFSEIFDSKCLSQLEVDQNYEDEEKIAGQVQYKRTTNILSFSVANTDVFREDWEHFRSLVRLKNSFMDNWLYDKEKHITVCSLNITEDQEARILEFLPSLEPKIQELARKFHDEQGLIASEFSKQKSKGQSNRLNVLYYEIPPRIFQLCNEMTDLLVKSLVVSKTLDCPEQFNKLCFDEQTETFKQTKLHLTVLKPYQRSSYFKLNDIKEAVDFKFREIRIDRLAFKKLNAEHTILHSIQL